MSKKDPMTFDSMLLQDRVNLETSATRAFGDGWRKDDNGSNGAGLFQQVGVRFDQLRRGVNFLFIEKENRLPCHHLFDGCGKGDALVIHPTDFIRQAFDEPPRVRGIVRVVKMNRSGLISSARDRVSVRLECKIRQLFAQ